MKGSTEGLSVPVLIEDATDWAINIMSNLSDEGIISSINIVQHIICCCEALAHQRYNVFGNPFVEPNDMSTASVWDLCLFIRGTWLLNVY